MYDLKNFGFIFIEDSASEDQSLKKSWSLKSQNIPMANINIQKKQFEQEN